MADQVIAPGPKGSQLGRFDRDAIGFVTAMEQEHGGIVRISLGPFVVHLVSDPDAVKHILQDNAKNYVRGKFYGNFDLFFGRGMLTTDGAEWRERRQVSQPFFHKPRLVEKSPAITECAEDLVAGWEGAADRGEVVDVTDDVMTLSMGVFGKMFLGVDLRPYSAELQPATLFAMQAVLRSGSVSQLLPRWVPTRYRRTSTRHRATLDRVMDEVVERHVRGEVEEHTVVSALLAARDEHGDPWPREAVLAELKTLFLAGHETTGCSIVWTLHALSRHPEVRRRLEAEVAEVLGGRTPTVDDLADLPYLKQVVSESLRLYPAVWSYPRDVVADDTIGGYHVPAGSSVLLSSYVTQHSRSLWENPEAFDPQRFCPAHQVADRPKYAYYPFGGGARKCIGFEAALMEVQLVVATVVGRVRVDSTPGRPIGMWPKASLRPMPNVLMTASRVPS
ncbi:cytochrome P450 [Umezawaea endophytica]|uniref:Cytochrome P450 n=1 Tax=Umezawaea endophytica TaxID=1654476 RepID=A0A9X3AHG8_9PSEU|nr:cytochrome P450 [Umezawaea endophytica]MCS7480991.1 cytochrome P450 [Umezawaea endophytica]